MFTKVKNKLKSEDSKRLLSNFISLSILQGANYILPLITLPYLVRILGVEYFGLLAFATATIAYFTILTDYGFNLTATREISIHRDNKVKIIEIFSSVMSIKIILMVVSFLLLSVLVFSFEKFSEHWEVYFLTFGTIVGQVLFPVWFFQGMERMKYITYLNILAKSIFTVAIFIFVKEQSDFWIVPLLTSIGFIVAGIYSLVLVYKKFDVKFKLQKIGIMKLYLNDGWDIFISGIFTSFYTISTSFILGIFTNNTVVGYYALAEKLVKAVGGMFAPINGTIFPYIAKLTKKSHDKAKIFVNKVLILASIIMGILSLFIFMYAKEIILLVSTDKFLESIILLKILALFPLVITIARIFSTNYLINFGYSNYLSKIYLYSAFLSLILSFSLVPYFNAVGSAISVVFTEIFATSYMYVVIRKKI